MRFYMARKTDTTAPEVNTIKLYPKSSRTVFIGAYVRPEIRAYLTSLGAQAPGFEERPLTWAINQILETHYATKVKP